MSLVVGKKVWIGEQEMRFTLRTPMPSTFKLKSYQVWLPWSLLSEARVLAGTMIKAPLYFE